MSVRIIDLDPNDQGIRQRAAELLVEGFRELSPESWNDLPSALEEVEEALDLGSVRVALDDSGDVVGWIGARPGYRGRVWEIHPVVVDEASRRQGIGRALLEDVERLAADGGALTLTLGSDDEIGSTSLAGVDLYPTPLDHLARIADVGGHPFGFYLRCGFSLTGVLPDANGFGRPDIFLSKRVTPRSTHD